MNRIFDDVKFQLDMLSCVLGNLSDHDYRKKGLHIKSIGAHVRHALEYIFLLVSSDINRPLNYAERKRDDLIENDRLKAIETVSFLMNRLHKTDHEILLKEDGETYISSYNREMLYMHEHIVHHCAILKIELNSIPTNEIDPCFGFAKSTIKHMKMTE